jgi:hypothetical protein
MNICRMTKWIWKLYAVEQGLWADILRAKYLSAKDLLVDKHPLGSQFQNSIQNIKEVFSLRAKHRVKNETSTRFWADWWSGRSLIRVHFPSLYAISDSQEAVVAQL